MENIITFILLVLDMIFINLYYIYTILNVKTMSAHGSHLGWRSWSPNTFLKVYYQRTIHAMFALNWLTGFRREDLNNFPMGPMLKLCPLMVAILDGVLGHWI